MKKFIVTTTIQKPTEATFRFMEMSDWEFIVVGDLKTPADIYERMDLIYLSTEYQEQTYPNLSKAIPWNCIMRRNLGFVEAYRRGADIVATIDDDNIPLENWGKNILLGKEILTTIFDTKDVAFDPLVVTNHHELWHRGFPIQDIATRASSFTGIRKELRKVLIQADLWNGDPDIDAVCRMIYNPTGLILDVIEYPYSSNKFMPFNSQNTFLAREVLPYYMVLPYVGRVDDIWGGYIVQHCLNTRPVFMPPTTYQERNVQSLDKNLADEFFGYRYTKKFISDIENFEQYLPKESLTAYEAYQNEYRS